MKLIVLLFMFFALGFIVGVSLVEEPVAGQVEGYDGFWLDEFNALEE